MAQLIQPLQQPIAITNESLAGWNNDVNGIVIRGAGQVDQTQVITQMPVFRDPKDVADIKAQVVLIDKAVVSEMNVLASRANAIFEASQALLKTNIVHVDPEVGSVNARLGMIHQSYENQRLAMNNFRIRKVLPLLAALPAPVKEVPKVDKYFWQVWK